MKTLLRINVFLTCVVIVLFFVGQWLEASSPPQPCPPGAVPYCPFIEDCTIFFPHEMDCHWFFMCRDGIAYCRECPADLHWNVELETCDWPSNAGCASAFEMPY